MFKSFKNLFYFVFVLFLLTSCNNDDQCIEKNDFGDYDTDAFYINSKNDGCVWTDDGLYGTGSYTVETCIKKISENPIKISSTCSILTSCASIRDCIINNDGKCGNCTGLSRKDLELAFKNCTNTCINSCKKNNTYETSWAFNSDSVKFINNGTFSVQALGTLELKSSSQKDIIFDANMNEVQYKPIGKDKEFILSSPEVISLSSVSQNPVDMNNFLRRGVLILGSLPDGSSLAPDNTYVGPLLKPDFSSWKCTIGDTSTGINESTTADYNCITDYASIDINYSDKNNELYAIEDTFKKTIGGFIVPTYNIGGNSPLIKYITPEVPFKNASCSTNSSGIRQCRSSNSEDSSLISSSAVVSGNSEINVMKNDFLLSSSGFSKKFLYPSVAAFRIIGNASGTCKAYISIFDDNNNPTEISNLEIDIPADNNWHIARRPNGDKMVLNKDNTNTLISDSNGKADFSSSNLYTVNISFDSNDTWVDENGNNLKCGDGMVAFFMPQNEILIDKSGFLSFKNLFAQTNTCNASDIPTMNATCVNGAYNLSFTIINPMYEQRKNSDNSNLVNDNFYEYVENGVNNPEQQTITLDLSNNSWSDKIFVRKGQILRFDESNWYDINTSGTSIKNKVFKKGDIYKNISHGLVLRIEERPAIFCDGYESEKIVVDYNSDGTQEEESRNVLQCYDLENYKGAFRELRKSGVEKKGDVSE